MATIALVVGLEMALVGIFGWPTDGDSPPPPQPTSMGLITFPAVNAKVDWCTKVRSKDLPPEGYTRRFGAAPVYEQDSNYYLPRDRRDDGTAWPVYVGASGDYNKDFDVVAYDVPNGVLSKYTADDVRSRAYTLDALKADGIKIVDKVRVSRKDAATTSKDACAKEPR